MASASLLPDEQPFSFGGRSIWGSVNGIDIFARCLIFSGMARKLRIQYPGAIYHLMSRGDRREDIFEDDQDRRCFLETLSETCEKTQWQVQAYCLMSNHCELVIETPAANLVAGMK